MAIRTPLKEKGRMACEYSLAYCDESGSNSRIRTQKSKYAAKACECERKSPHREANTHGYSHAVETFLHDGVNFH